MHICEFKHLRGDLRQIENSIGDMKKGICMVGSIDKDKLSYVLPGVQNEL